MFAETFGRQLLIQVSIGAAAAAGGTG